VRVPTAARVEQFKKFMWITTCIAAPVLEEPAPEICVPAAAVSAPNGAWLQPKMLDLLFEAGFR